MKTESFIVTIDNKNGESVAALKSYVRESVEMWRKGMNPELDLFQVKKLVKSIKAIDLKKKKKIRRSVTS